MDLPGLGLRVKHPHTVNTQRTNIMDILSFHVISICCAEHTKCPERSQMGYYNPRICSLHLFNKEIQGKFSDSTVILVPYAVDWEQRPCFLNPGMIIRNLCMIIRNLSVVKEAHQAGYFI